MDSLAGIEQPHAPQVYPRSRSCRQFLELPCEVASQDPSSCGKDEDSGHLARLKLWRSSDESSEPQVHAPQPRLQFRGFYDSGCCQEQSFPTFTSIYMTWPVPSALPPISSAIQATGRWKRLRFVKRHLHYDSMATSSPHSSPICSCPCLSLMLLPVSF